MKKILVAVLALGMLALLCACGGFEPLLPGTEASTKTEGGTDEENFEPTVLYTFLGWDDFAADYYVDTPVALTYTSGSGNSCSPSPVFDRTSIIAACDALRDMMVTGKSDGETTDNESVYTFTMSNGEKYSVTFANDCVVMNGCEYTVTGGDALKNLVFPGYGGDFSLFDLYYSDAITAFAENFDQSTPVSVSRQENSGALLTSEDPTVIKAVFDALAGASVNYVEPHPDQNIDLTKTVNYIFTMEDGTQYTFTFDEKCLAVTVSDAYGPVYYWLNGIDGLWDISVMPDDDTVNFTGGAITGLRLDLQELQDILDGNRTDLSILGVYVDYTINGETGYVTLDGSNASSFLSTVLGITSDGQTVSSPDGETITISVTLSDGSGPILTFTGDAVQQVVGTWFQCDSSGMSAMRSTILNLAAA